ncbi:MAG: TlpA family protein disulfide reductase [Deltaproteobacteria bacterium]|nr:TlpA family protein disulfide reductase [Deltaproteobacteria bacterium]MBW2444662.1 TlpA family protein disulfide reductase [Deltaproteobacteria bacterium]
MRVGNQHTATRWLAGLALAFSACEGGTETTAHAETSDAGAGHAAVAAPAADDDRMAAPSWELPDLEGKLIQSGAYAGKTVVMDFWATWCPPCLFQIPILNAIQAKHVGDGIVVIGVAVDAEGAEVVKPYAQENGIEYQLVIGDEGLARKFGAPGFPALAVVSPDGKIDSMHVGLIEEAELEAAIAKGQGS